MAKTVDDYISALSGWQRDVAEALRAAILAGGEVKEAFKWGHPVYEAGGPVCLVKVYPKHLTLGFWRGADMLDLDGRLERGGSFDMASIKLDGAGQISAREIGRLIAAGVSLNRQKGDPLKSVKKQRSP